VKCQKKGSGEIRTMIPQSIRDLHIFLHTLGNVMKLFSFINQLLYNYCDSKSGDGSIVLVRVRAPGAPHEINHLHGLMSSKGPRLWRRAITGSSHNEERAAAPPAMSPSRVEYEGGSRSWSTSNRDRAVIAPPDSAGPPRPLSN